MLRLQTVNILTIQLQTSCGGRVSKRAGNIKSVTPINQLRSDAS